MDFKGQITLEYMMIFFVLLIVLSVITIPLMLNALETSDEVITSIETKNFLVEVQKNIKLVYSMDRESKRGFSIYVPCDMKLYYQVSLDKKYLSTTLFFADNSRKVLKVEVPCEVSFNGYVNNHYVSLKKSWYYNTEVKYITTSNGNKSINVNFK